MQAGHDRLSPDFVAGTSSRELVPELHPHDGLVNIAASIYTGSETKPTKTSCQRHPPHLANPALSRTSPPASRQSALPTQDPPQRPGSRHWRREGASFWPLGWWSISPRPGCRAAARWWLCLDTYTPSCAHIDARTAPLLSPCIHTPSPSEPRFFSFANPPSSSSVLGRLGNSDTTLRLSRYSPLLFRLRPPPSPPLPSHCRAVGNTTVLPLSLHRTPQPVSSPRQVDDLSILSVN
ncbi:hypothetical protein QBC47DRAFT_18692 [Echria macrotheca]|uniref:Uncharacterized protein n=1 Tax=Echria macrotheca TaxID=438768 RepID=A0AAJ0FBB7_9PEZI|nr:hypothetical protein QBC47DRAFT_18692 [Echria macrotheca]